MNKFHIILDEENKKKKKEKENKSLLLFLFWIIFLFFICPSSYEQLNILLNNNPLIYFLFGNKISTILHVFAVTLELGAVYCASISFKGLGNLKDELKKQSDLESNTIGNNMIQTNENKIGEYIDDSDSLKEVINKRRENKIIFQNESTTRLIGKDDILDEETIQEHESENSEYPRLVKK